MIKSLTEQCNKDNDKDIIREKCVEDQEGIMTFKKLKSKSLANTLLQPTKWKVSIKL